MIDPALVLTSDPVAKVRALFSAGRHVVVADPSLSITDDLVDVLGRAASLPGVATASPVPVPELVGVLPYRLHEALPPPPSLALPCASLCVFGADALASLALVPDAASVSELVRTTATRLLAHGWRHVAAPGVALDWQPADSSSIESTAAWSAESVAALVGPANVGLEAHSAWARSVIGRISVVVDGACISEGPNTGTQHLVVEITRWLARTRASARVTLATPRGVVEMMRDQLGPDGVDVVERRNGIRADVVYRPYQMIFASELDFLHSVGHRRLVGQLDMIGFSNPFYHPSESLFFFARNIQRHLMRSSDGVTFISEFGRDSALAECPDLEPRRLHVVSCGADPVPTDGRFDRGWPFPADAQFLVCLSSTFWHKNRTHAIALFDRLVRERGYPGRLVLGGPEPYYGRSLAEEQALLVSLGDDVSARVHHIGHVSDAARWWLLRHADLTVYPSVVEGFGLVPFESAAVGTPCLAFAGTAPGELLAGTPALVRGWNLDEWVEAADALLADPVVAAHNVEGIMQAAARHTWRNCAERTWAAIDHAIASPAAAGEVDDGTAMTRVASPRLRAVPGASLRFDIMRAAPAIARRLRARMRPQETRR